MTLWTGDYMQHFQSTSNSLEKIYISILFDYIVALILHDVSNSSGMDLTRFSKASILIFIHAPCFQDQQYSLVGLSQISSSLPGLTTDF